MIDSPGPVRRETPPAPPAVVAVVRAVALVVVLPVRVLWELLVAGARWTRRRLIDPVGRFLARWLLRPLAWLLRWLVGIPLVWLGRALGWSARTLVWIPLAWLAYHLLRRPVGWLAGVLAPVGRLLVAGLGALARWLGGAALAVGRVLWAGARWAWWAAGRVLWWAYVVTLRPVVRGACWVWRHGVAPVGRALAAAWRATVSPVTRWVGRTVVDPVRATVGEVLAALGVRRP
ncbi:hypothetical protein [Micromonospora endolithica]|uniref:hypothetical protein n=1 Tax=Micromonospora endolithica TaxID=230091 RepID=UPI0011BFB541|nr:hypothetical protein [Micromonospora endolithica]